MTDDHHFHRGASRPAADRRPPMIAFARMLLICAALAAGAAAAVSYAPDSWFGGGVPMGPG